MAFELTKLSNTSIVVLTLSRVFNARQVLAAAADEINAASDLAQGGIVIIDARTTDLSFTSTTLSLIEDVRRVAAAKGTQTFVVATPRLLEIIQYAGMRVCTFTNLEDAVRALGSESIVQDISDELAAGHMVRNVKQAGNYAPM